MAFSWWAGHENSPSTPSVGGDQYIKAPSAGGDQYNIDRPQGQVRVHSPTYNYSFSYSIEESSPAPQALAGLPIAPAQLPGRAVQVDTLLSLLSPNRRGSDEASVCAVAGLPGVGKTALALYVAHQAIERNWFAGGALFVDLRGYDQTEVAADQALGPLLRALGTRDADIPPTVAERGRLYRSIMAHLAQQRKPLLLVLDNAATSDQVVPLVPSQREHRVLVTSRHTLASPFLSARLIDIPVLDASDAAALVSMELLRADPGDRRPVQEKQTALERLVELCGFLPLALQIAAAILKTDRVRTIASLASGLEDSRTRLESLRYDEESGGSLAVKAAFDISYRRLTQSQAHMFRLVSTNPGPDFSTEAIAAAAGRAPRKVRPLLAGLAAAHLLEASPIKSERWRMHDLIHLYAAKLTEAVDTAPLRKQSLDRLLRYYLETLVEATHHLNPHRGQASSDRFGNAVDARAWVNLERPNLATAAAIAAKTGRRQTAWDITHLATVPFADSGHFSDLLPMARTALAAAQEAGSATLEATSWDMLGVALHGQPDLKEAVIAGKMAASMFRNINAPHSEAVALNNLGLTLQMALQFQEAVKVHSQERAIYQRMQDRPCEADALKNLGKALHGQAKFQKAASAFYEAAALFHEVGDEQREREAHQLFVAALQRDGGRRENRHRAEPPGALQRHRRSAK
jgi:tetratricopeptide (TPR) repeat protein